jgi:cell division initiation protein
MDLTPVRGYDAAQVDAFLDLVADRLDELVQGEVRLTEQVQMLREQLGVFQERERALNEALIAAQELREEARTRAEQAAELRVREAEHEAERLIGDARRGVEDATRALQDLQRRRDGFLRGLRSMLERFLADVDHEETRFGDDGGQGTGSGAGDDEVR